MNRRAFLAIASGGLAGLAGCSGFEQAENPVRDEDATPMNPVRDGAGPEQPTRLGIRNVRYDDEDLVVEVSDQLDVTSHVEIRSETGESVTSEVSEYEARAEIVESQNFTRSVGEGELTIILYDDQGESVDETTLEYNPQLGLNVIGAVGSIYHGAEVPAASALFTWENSGTGPTYLKSFEVREGENAIPVKGSDEQATFLRTAKVAGLDSSIFDPVGIDEDNSELFMPQGSPLAFGGDGLFVHIGGEPEETETFEQQFRTVARTVFEQEFMFEVTVEFTGGIVEAPIETPQGETAYHFEEFDITSERIRPS